jgi:hypothetical protein
MTPFVPPGGQAHRTAPHGIAEHYAEAAYWKEKMYFDEEFLNNLRQPGTTETYQTAEAKLARELAFLSYRSDRRKEWMFAQMLFNNGFTYWRKGEVRTSIDYGIPSDHRITLGSTVEWESGASRDILGNIQDWKRMIKNDTGADANVAIFNSYVLKLLANDSAIRDILKRQNFMGGAGGSSNLFEGTKHNILGVNANVIGSLLDIETMYVYDEMYEIKAFITSGVTGGSTTHFTVSESHDFEVGGTLRFWDQSAGTYEDVYIIGVDQDGMSLQIDNPPANTYVVGEDYVTMQKEYIPSDKFVLMATSVDGQPIAEYKMAPFGLGRHYGQFTDRKEEWDPEGVYIRVQDKGLPILYNRDAMVIATVWTPPGLAATSTTTSSSTTTTTP